MKSLTIIAGLLAFLSGGLKAQTVDWGTSNTGTNELFQSTGAAAGSAMTWDLGYFTVGFTPSSANVTNWAANWNSISTATQAPPDMNLNVTNASVPASLAGTQAYMFGYSSLTTLGTPGTEAFLATSTTWVLPSEFDQLNIDIAANPFDVADTLDVIWGAVDRQIGVTGGVVTGGGTLSVAKADEGFEIQTATWPVPEPSSVTLLATVLFSFLGRRHRK